MIENFIGIYDFLSNFYMIPVYYEGLWFPSSEHAYQAAKTIILAERLMILSCKTAGQAKRMGSKKAKKITIRPDWDSMRYDVMLEIIKSKFSNPHLMHKLIDTYPDLLVEGNAWHDNFWGNCRCEDCKNIFGFNNLGLILMTVRAFYKGGQIESIVCN